MYVCVCVCVCICAYLLSPVRLFVTPWAVAHQAPLSMGVLQARILECVAMPSSGDHPNPRIELRSSALQADSLPSEPPGKPQNTGMGNLSLLRGTSQPRNWTGASCIAGGFFNQLSYLGSPFFVFTIVSVLQNKRLNFVYLCTQRWTDS